MSVHGYELRVETGDIRPVLSLFRLKSRLDEFLGLLSSFVPIKADVRRTLNYGQLKILLVTPLCSCYRTNDFLDSKSRWFGLLHNPVKH